VDDFAPWFQEEYPKVVAACAAMSRDQSLAVDAASEAFSRAYERWDHVRRLSSPGGWVCQVALNVVRRFLRRRAIEYRLLRRRPSPDRIEPPLPEPELWAAVSKLSSRMRTIVILRYLGDLPEKEIADVLHISRGTVAATLSAAHDRLAKALSDDRPLGATRARPI
jgi:RNA polymerase sigma factor (sigma-70 family)